MLLGKTATRRVMKLSRAYVRKLYNQHATTIVASDLLGRVLRDCARDTRRDNLGTGAPVGCNGLSEI